MNSIIISVHDVAPCFQREIEAILQHFDNQLTLLITPFWDKKYALTPDFVQLLRGYEKVLHGFHHRNVKGDWLGKLAALSARSDRELYGLTRCETAELISEGKRLFEDAFGESPKGFVPPTWTHNAHSIGLLQDMGFGFTETAWQLLNLQNSETNCYSCIKTPAVCFDYGNNQGIERLSIATWRHFLKWFSPDLVRISIHPSDVDNNYLAHLDTLIQILRDKNYSFTNYQNFFDSCFPLSSVRSTKSNIYLNS